MPHLRSREGQSQAGARTDVSRAPMCRWIPLSFLLHRGWPGWRPRCAMGTSVETPLACSPFFSYTNTL